MTNPTFTVFYSWQSDRPSPLNWGFIQDALKKAAKGLKKDETIEVDCVLDRDTQGVPGSPDISVTIFQKISQCQAFVADVTIIHDGNEPGRRGPNPNVMVELGYALKTLGWDRVMMVMNTAFGGVELLPFDLPRRRITGYELTQGAQKAEVRNVLAGKLEGQLREMLADFETATPPKDQIEDLTSAIAAGAAEVDSQLREYMAWLVEQLDGIAPPTDPEGPADEALVNSLEASLDLVVGFGKVVDAIARYNSEPAALALYSGFEGILERYEVRMVGTNRRADFYKFLGHELFVMLIAALMAHDRLEVVARVLEEPLVTDSPEGSRAESFDNLSESVRLLDERAKRLRIPTLLHATVLKERRDNDALRDVSPFLAFMEADFILWTRQELEPEEFIPDEPNFDQWMPWSTVFLDTKRPKFLAKSANRPFAQRLIPLLAVPDIETLRKRWGERSKRIGGVFHRYRPSSVKMPDANEIGAQ